MSACAWVTLATNDSYSLGALVLAQSLRTVGTAHQLAVMVTPGVTPSMREHLQSVFDLVHDVNVLDSNDASNLALLARPELGITFTKLHCWSLTQYTKCVFMDADTLVLQACDELFEREELSAAPDVGWPDCFNSGVFVFRPSTDTFKNLIDFALSRGSFDGGDQGLLNLYFSNWATEDSSRRLPFIYNMCSTAVYSYLPAFKQFGNDAKIVHFIGQMKPWLLELDTQSGLVTPSPGYEHLRPILQQWWSIFLAEVLPKLQPDMRDDEGLSMVFDSHELMGGVTRYDPRSFEESPDPDIRQAFYDPWDSFQAPCPVTHEDTCYVRHEPRELEAASTSIPTHIPSSHETQIEEWTEPSQTETIEPQRLPVSPPPSETCKDGDGAESIIIASADSDGGGMAGALAQLSIGSVRSEQQVALEQHWRRQAWEQGNADYLGKDAFDKIWQKIQTTLQGVQPPAGGDAPPAPPPVEPPVAVEPPPCVPTEPIAQEVAAPASVVPTSPPPGDQKTPAQPPPSASATPKSEPLDAPPSGAESAPIPPKRRGGPNKGGKSGQKGKK